MLIIIRNVLSLYKREKKIVEIVYKIRPCAKNLKKTISTRQGVRLLTWHMCSVDVARPNKNPTVLFGFILQKEKSGTERALFILDNFTDNILRYRYNKVPSGVG